jgi:hypothetical protein
MALKRKPAAAEFLAKSVPPQALFKALLFYPLFPFLINA